jgi:hypothetical protein
VRARLARVLLVVVLLAGWQAALEHAIGHANHEQSTLCDALEALTACAAKPQSILAQPRSDDEAPSHPVDAPRVAEAPPFLSQGPPAPMPESNIFSNA